MTRAWYGCVLTLLICGACREPQAPRIRIASDALFPPFHFVDDYGKATGHDLALARAVLEHAGYAHETRIVRPYSALLGGLTKGDHDLVAATTGITPERQLAFRFSDPYYETCQAVLVRRGPGEPETLADLRGRPVGAAGAGTSARALLGLEGAQPVQLKSGAEGLDALQERTIDGFVVDEFEAVAAARRTPQQLRVLSKPVALEQYGFVMPLDRPDLQEKVNAALGALQADGTIDRIRRQFAVGRDADWPVRWSIRSR